MMLSENELIMPCIIFEKEIDTEDANKIVSIFKNWMREEVEKRATKRGKLLEVSICSSENHYSVMFGNSKKYLDISNGYLIGNDILKTMKVNEIYLNIVNEVINFITEFVKENELKLEVKPSGGIANYYVISRV